jgi:phosphotransferase system  glucose/maltose/N-acetylglucosamine-specific IIC component
VKILEPAPNPVGTAINSGVTQALDVIGDNMPLVFGVAIAFVAWNVGKRVLGKI